MFSWVYQPVLSTISVNSVKYFLRDLLTNRQTPCLFHNSGDKPFGLLAP